MYEQHQIVYEAPAAKRQMSREETLALAYMVLDKLGTINRLLDEAIVRMEARKLAEEETC